MMAALKQTADRLDKAAALIAAVGDLNQKMRNHLELLGADTSAYMLSEKPLP
jgi:hypothetical protein